MQKKTWLIPFYSAVCGAIGMFLHWMQQLSNYEEDTGLFTRGSASSSFLIFACIAFTAALYVLVRVYLGTPANYDVVTSVRTKDIFLFAVATLAGLIMIVGGIIMFFGSRNTSSPGITKFLAVFAVVCGLCFPGMAAGTGTDKPTSFHCLCSAVPVLMCLYWLIVQYKLFAYNPEIWLYAFDILAVSASTLSFYFIAGFFFGCAKPRNTVFFSQLAVFLCLVDLINKAQSGYSVMMFACALIQAMFSWVIVRNCVRTEKQPSFES